MEIVNLLEFTTREELREWLIKKHRTVRECWVTVNRSKLPRHDSIPYAEVVEEALCFGWIDSTLKRLPDGRCAQRLSPRRKNSHWTDLNKQRCQDLIQRGLMTSSGLATLPEQTPLPINQYRKIMQEQLDRISRYEKIMRETDLLLHKKHLTPKMKDRMQKLVSALEDYYGSNEWRQDYEADEHSLLPKDLDRGVLSEDGIYNLLERYQSLMFPQKG